MPHLHSVGVAADSTTRLCGVQARELRQPVLQLRLAPLADGEKAALLLVQPVRQSKSSVRGKWFSKTEGRFMLCTLLPSMVVWGTAEVT